MRLKRRNHPASFKAKKVAVALGRTPIRVWCVGWRECNNARGDIGSGAVGRRSRFAHSVDQPIAQSRKVAKNRPPTGVRLPLRMIGARHRTGADRRRNRTNPALRRVGRHQRTGGR